MAADQGGRRGHAVAGQLGHPPRRHPRLGAEPRQPDTADLGHPVQGLDERRAAPARCRALAPPLQVRQPRPRRDVQQPAQRAPLDRAGERGQFLPQLARRLVADLRDQAREPRHPGQQDVPLPQPRQPIGEDRLRAVPGRPRAGRCPSGELLLGVGELPVPAGPPDLPLVIEPRLLPLGVPLHLRRVGQAHLAGHEVQHLGRHVERVLHERPQPPHHHQLQREPGPHVVPAVPAYTPPVIVIEEEHPLQVRLRRRPREPAVRRSLTIRQELHRHRPHRKAANTTTSPTAIKPLQAFRHPATSERPLALTRPRAAP